MGTIRLNNSVYSVGVLNPALRVFDIIMTADYGTSYNSYLVKAEKTALIDTVHAGFFDEYLSNIEDLTNVNSIDYLIMNHTEPDHSGSIAKLLELNPNMTVVCSMAAKKYLSKIVNRDFACVAVKSGDTLDLGGKILEFVIAPFLHWPDSMFTYLKEDKILFSCDVFGAHYCEPRMLDTHIQYPQKYETAFRYYYDAIFSPFKEHVLSGLGKLSPWDIGIICPSHGPIHVDHIRERMDQYRLWSQPPEARTKKAIAIIYGSAYGYTRTLADTAKDVLVNEFGFTVDLFDIVESDPHEVSRSLNGADGIMIGCCTINRNVPEPLANALNGIDAIGTKGRPAAVFGSYGWSGEAVGMIRERLQNLKCNVAGDGYRVNFKPDEQDLAGMREYTRMFAQTL